MWVPDAGSEALRDLVRAHEAAKQDQLRARHRLSKFLLRTGQRRAQGVKAWTLGYMAWARQLRFAQAAQESTRLDYLHEVEHMGERVLRLEQAIAEAVQLASPELREVTRGLQALRGIAQISAVTIAAELGNICRFASARQLMEYSGTVPSENSSGQRTQRGGISQTGNAHLRRIAIEATWSYRLRPGISTRLMVALHYLKYQQDLSDEDVVVLWVENPLLAALQRHEVFSALAAASRSFEHDALAQASGRCRGRADAARHD